MKILIVEDEKLAVRKLTKLLEETEPDFVVAGVTPSIEATVEWLQENRDNGGSEPDLIFMDIELADGQSFEIFNRIQVTSTVIFTTSYDEYALQAFKVNSIDYLLKPVQQEDLKRSIQKFYSMTGARKEEAVQTTSTIENLLKNFQLHLVPADYRKRFLVKQGSRMLSVEVSDIAYFYIEDGVSHFKNLSGQKFVVDYRMDELAEILDPAQFFRINRSMIITHQTVTQISPYFNNRLALNLKPVFERETIVSREKTNDFKVWMGK